MKIIKRDGREVPYDYTRIKKAIEAANGEVAEEDRLTDTEVGFIVGRIEKRCTDLGRSVGVEEIQDMVIDELEKSEHYRLALHYSEYRLRHELLRKQNSTDKKILSLLRHDNELAKQENANKDPIINSTMRDYLASEVSEDICRRYIFPENVIKAHDEGMIHIHDITNSYHVHVTEEIDAFSKLAFEAEFQALSPGGAISYVEVPNMQNNIPAVLSVMRFIYENIMYAELNTKSEWCDLKEQYVEGTGEEELGFELGSFFVPFCEVMRFYGGTE